MPSTAARRHAGRALFSDPQWIYVDLGATGDHHARGAQLGGGLRKRVSGPGLERRQHLDVDLLHDHRRGRRERPQRLGRAAATCACTARSAAPPTATRSGSSRSTARSPPARPPTAGRRARSLGRSRPRTTTRAVRASPSTTPRPATPAASTAATPSTSRRPRTPVAATTSAGRPPASGSSTR